MEEVRPSNSKSLLKENPIKSKKRKQEPFIRISSSSLNQEEQAQEKEVKKILMIPYEPSLEEILNRGWTQCCYFLLKKKRLCNIARKPNSYYCGNHHYYTTTTSIPTPTPMTTTTTTATMTTNTMTAVPETGSNESVRIPCPVDPSHTIYLHNLESHKKICNAAKHQAMLTALPYYCHNCNGNCAASICHSVTSGNSNEKEENLDLDQLIQKIHQAYEKVAIDDQDKSSSSSMDYSVLDEKIRSNVGGGLTAFDRLRHIEQDIALVHHMIENHLLAYRTKPSTDKKEQQQEAEKDVLPYICVEFGAGKGLLTQSIAMADYQASCILIERSSNRRKIDRFLIEEDYKIERLRMDIRHCFLPKVPGIIDCLPGTQIVAVAKHLCGLASDLAIHSLSHLMGDPYKQHLRRGLAVATCCHHACNVMDYVGWEWLSQCGFHIGEFEFLKKWSGWAHLDRSISSAERRRRSKRPLKNDGSNMEEESEGEDEVEDEHAQPMTSAGGAGIGSGMNRPVSIAEEDMPMIGKKIKRILDYGRVLYLRNVLKMKVKYLRYCDEKLSPECMVILAWDDNQQQEQHQQSSLPHS